MDEYVVRPIGRVESPLVVPEDPLLATIFADMPTFSFAEFVALA
jgi:hypothetical protein